MTVTILGTTDAVDSCDCCGRTGLKATVAIRFDDSAEVQHYGRTCAARRVGVPASTIDAGVRSAAAAARAADNAARAERSAAELHEWTTFVHARTGLELIDGIAALGGFAAARALYATRTTQPAT